MNEDKEFNIPEFEPEKIFEEYDRKSIIQLMEENQYFTGLRNKHQFENVPYEKSWSHTVELIREKLKKEMEEYESRYNKKFEPSK